MAQELQRRYDIKRFYNKSMQGKGVNREMSKITKQAERLATDMTNTTLLERIIIAKKFIAETQIDRIDQWQATPVDVILDKYGLYHDKMSDELTDLITHEQYQALLQVVRTTRQNTEDRIKMADTYTFETGEKYYNQRMMDKATNEARLDEL